MTRRGSGRRCALLACVPLAAGLLLPSGAGAGLIQNATGPLGVTTPTVPQIPDVPGAPPPVNGTIHTLNNTVSGTAGGGGGSNKGSGSQPSTPATGGGAPSAGSSPSAGGAPSARGGSASGSGGGGASSGGAAHRHGHGSSRAHRSGATRKHTASAAGGHTRPAAKTKPKHKKSTGSTSTVARVINRITNVIPAPLWGLIGALALLALGFALRSRLILLRARRLERHRAELLGDVGLLQRALLPDVPEGLAGIDVSVAYRPAEGPAAGGDFYDVFPLDDKRTAIIVGDVCGHGRQALAVTALMRYTLRAYMGAGFEPRIALQVAGRTIAGDADAELTTVVLAVYDAAAGTLTYACAGHEPPIVLGPNALEPVVVLSSPPLAAPTPTGHRQTTIALPPGSSACFFTDGLVEARLGDEMIGRQALTEMLGQFEPDDGAQLLLDRIAQRADRAPDDMAACLVRTRADAVSGPAVRTEELALERGDSHHYERTIDFLTACGLDVKQAGDAVVMARAKVAEFGGALIRVLIDSAGATAEVKGVEDTVLTMPALDAAARSKAGSLLEA